MKIKTVTRRISKNFAEKILDDIKVERVRQGKDRKLLSDARLTEGLVCDEDFQIIKRKLILKPRKEQLR